MKRLLAPTILLMTLSVAAADKSVDCSPADVLTAQSDGLLKVVEKLEEAECPAPNESDYRSFCSDIASRSKTPESERRLYEYHYEKRLWTVSCADPMKDNEEKSLLKIQKMWNKYQKNFKCDSINFNVPNGNLLKFSIAASAPDVLETFVSIYDLDINFVDPADNMNLLDYLNSEIAKLKKKENTQSAIRTYEQYRAGIIGLGAMPSTP